MIIKDGSGFVNGFTQPIRTMAQRFAYGLLVIFAFLIILFGKIDPITVENVRTQVIDTMAPLLNISSKFTESIYTIGQKTSQFFEVREENNRLRKENKRLLEWQTLAHKLETENLELRNLLNFVPSRDASFITARLVADTSGAFANSIVLNAGERNNVRKGQAAIVGDGLVGRVAGVGKNSSRVLLATDLNSRIPVNIQPANIRAILAGDNSSYPKLIHLPPGAVIEQGERIVTSGHGGAFPPGLPVGVIKLVNEGNISVKLFADRSKMVYVRLLDYGIHGIVKMPPVKSGVATTGLMKNKE